MVSIISIIAIEGCARSLSALIWRRRSGIWLIVGLAVADRRLAIRNPTSSVHGRSSTLASTTVVVAGEQESKKDDCHDNDYESDPSAPVVPGRIAAIDIAVLGIVVLSLGETLNQSRCHCVMVECSDGCVVVFLEKL